MILPCTPPPCLIPGSSPPLPPLEVGTSRDEETVDAIFSRMRALTSAARAVRCCGSCAMNMCGVAMGRLDVFYEIGESYIILLVVGYNYDYGLPLLISLH